MLLNQDVHQHIINTLENYPEIEVCYLFGSRARGDAQERSDIDLALGAPQLSETRFLELSHYFKDELPTLLSVDIVRMDEAPSNLKKNILNEGEVIYERKKAMQSLIILIGHYNVWRKLSNEIRMICY